MATKRRRAAAYIVRGVVVDRCVVVVVWLGQHRVKVYGRSGEVEDQKLGSAPRAAVRDGPARSGGGCARERERAVPGLDDDSTGVVVVVRSARARHYRRRRASSSLPFPPHLTTAPARSHSHSSPCPIWLDRDGLAGGEINNENDDTTRSQIRRAVVTTATTTGDHVRSTPARRPSCNRPVAGECAAACGRRIDDGRSFPPVAHHGVEQDKGRTCRAGCCLALHAPMRRSRSTCAAARGRCATTGGACDRDEAIMSPGHTEGRRERGVATTTTSPRPRTAQRTQNNRR